MSNGMSPGTNDRSTTTGLREVSTLAAALLLASSLLLPWNLSAGEDVDSIALLDSLAWMAGCWGTTEDGSSADECWLGRRGNVMMGFHVDVFESGKVFFEYLRVVAEGDEVTYMASPMGGSATPFLLVETDEHRAVFENPDHDWPQRLTYWREDDRLHAQAEGLDDSSRKAHWVWALRTEP